MSSHPRSTSPGHAPLSQPPPQVFRVTAALLFSIVLGVLLMVTAELHARSIEALITDGVQVDGVITDVFTKNIGGRTPSYHISGIYTVPSRSGATLTMPFSFIVTASEHTTFKSGDILPLMYDQVNAAEPWRLSDVEREDPTGLRIAAFLAGGAYIAVGVILSVLDWRSRIRHAQHSARLRSAFGAK